MTLEELGEIEALMIVASTVSLESTPAIRKWLKEQSFVVDRICDAYLMEGETARAHRDEPIEALDNIGTIR